MDNEQETTNLKDFLSSLASGKYTKWAVNLDEQTLSALFWALGEFGYRANSTFEENCMNIRIVRNVSVDRDGVPLGRVAAALTAIIEIVGGKKITLNELKRWIAESCPRHGTDS
jgi:hypothetical protein